MTKCYKCGADVRAGTGRDVQMEVATGRSGGSWSFGTRRGKNGSTQLSPRYYTGRTYYKKVWAKECDDCITKSNKRRTGCLGWVVIISIFMLISMCSSSNNVPRSVEHPQTEQPIVEQKELPSGDDNHVVWEDVTNKDATETAEEKKE